MNGQELKLDPVWKWAAKDGNGDTYLYDTKPDFRPVSKLWFNSGEDLSFPFTNDLGEPADSLHQIIDGKLVKYVDIPADGEKVIVWACPTYPNRRYSAGEIDEEGELVCYGNGRDKWTTNGESLISWKNWRRPTAEELAG